MSQSPQESVNSHITELQQTGRTVFPYNKTRGIWSVFGCFGAVLVGLFIIFFPYRFLSFLPVWVDVAVGLLAILAGLIGVLLAIRALNRREQVTLDRVEGIVSGPESGGPGSVTRIPWGDITEVGTYSQGLSQATTLQLTPEGYARVQAQHSGAKSTVTKMSADIVGENTYTLPAIVQGRESMPAVVAAALEAHRNQP